MADRTSFTKPAAERIAKAVRIVEAGKRDTPGISQGVRLQDIQGAAITFRMCTFTGTWDKGTAHLTTFYGVTTTPNTVTATNLFVDIQSSAATSSSTTAACAIARWRGEWYLIAAECS